jgi:hypothetical protein
MGPAKVLGFVVIIVVVLIAANSYFFAGKSPRLMMVRQGGFSVGNAAPTFSMGGGSAGIAYDMSDKMAVSESAVISPFPPAIQVPVPASTSYAPKDDRKVIKNGSLDLLVKNADDAVRGITTVASTYKGFVDSSNIYEISEGVKQGSVTIRVPGDSFAAAIEDLKKLAVKVRNENSNSQDVTAQFVDLEARLKNMKAEELQYQEIMKRAVKIEDILNVSQRLYIVRGQIEETQGQMNYLSRQIEMSSITISLTSETEVQVFGIVWRPLTVLKQSIRSALTDLTSYVNWLIEALFRLPVLLLKLVVFVVILGVAWRVIVRLKKKFFSSAPSN